MLYCMPHKTRVNGWKCTSTESISQSLASKVMLSATAWYTFETNWSKFMYWGQSVAKAKCAPEWAATQNTVNHETVLCYWLCLLKNCVIIRIWHGFVGVGWIFHGFHNEQILSFAIQKTIGSRRTECSIEIRYASEIFPIEYHHYDTASLSYKIHLLVLLDLRRSRVENGIAHHAKHPLWIITKQIT